MFIDRINDWIENNQGKCSKLGFKPFLNERLKTAVVFKIQNISEYYWRNKQNEWHVIDDFPNVAPVYENIWFEWNVPQEICIKGKWKNNGIPITVGYYLYSVQLSSSLIPMSILSTIGADNIRKLKDDNIPYDIQWICMGMEFIEDKCHNIPVLTHTQTWWVKSDGTRWLPSLDNDIYMYPTIFPDNNIGERYQSMYKDGVDIGDSMNIPSLALSFLHCKNVEIKVNDISEQLNKARMRRNKLPLISFHTLEIAPMIKILKEQGEYETQGIKKALHICRGHFKDFTKGKGLFGKNQGLYWWDSQVRGKATEGISLKDYKISFS